MRNGVRVDSSIRDIVLIESTDSYFLFSENSFALFGKFLSDLLGELFEIEAKGERVIFEIFDDRGLPSVRVTGGFKFRGKVNENEGILSGSVASLGLTYFFQKHLVYLLSGNKGFTNNDYLDQLIIHSSSLKSDGTRGLSQDEEFQLYKFWD